MMSRSTKMGLIVMLSLVLSACLGFGSLNHKQVKMLKQQGFVLTDEGWSLGLPERLLFSFNEAEISSQNQNELNKLAQQLQKYKLNKLKIVGHTDNIGNNDYNLKLSKLRAQSVADVFIHNQFQQKNLSIIGRGSDQPINSEDSDAARAENRRVSIIVTP